MLAVGDRVHQLAKARAERLGMFECTYMPLVSRAQMGLEGGVVRRPATGALWDQSSPTSRPRSIVSSLTCLVIFFWLLRRVGDESPQGDLEI
jgi:hypothetical protein